MQTDHLERIVRESARLLGRHRSRSRGVHPMSLQSSRNRSRHDRLDIGRHRSRSRSRGRSRGSDSHTLSGVEPGEHRTQAIREAVTITPTFHRLRISLPEILGGTFVPIEGEGEEVSVVAGDIVHEHNSKGNRVDTPRGMF
jgi:hypothetical protein